MITVAVLVASIIISWPVISGAFKIHDLRDAGKIIEAACAEARVNAAGFKQIQVFRFKPESPYFLIEPAPPADLDAMLDFENIDEHKAIGNLRPIEEIDWELEGKQLPEGTYFVTIENRSDEHDVMLNELLPPTTEMMAEQKPLLFYPDGSCSDATIILRSGQGSFLEIKLDGASGNVTASEPIETRDLKQPSL